MKARVDSSANYLQKVVSLIIVILIVSAGGGLGLVWLRQQISITATRSQELERELIILDRNIRNLDAKIGEFHNPKNLLRQATDLGLKITLPGEDQIVRLTGDNDSNNIASNPGPEAIHIPGNLVSLNP